MSLTRPAEDNKKIIRDVLVNFAMINIFSHFVSIIIYLQIKHT